MSWEELVNMLCTETDVEVVNHCREEIAQMLPAVREMFDYNQNNEYHQYDLWMHCVYTVINLPRKMEDDMLYLAALLHDIGKPDCRCSGKKEDDINAHYYGHPARSVQIVREKVLPHLDKLKIELSEKQKKDLLYYVEYHDDRISFKIKHLRRHMKLTDIEGFRKLMQLQIADAKAHVIFPLVQERIDVCSLWLTEHADEMYEKVKNEEVEERVYELRNK